MYWKELYDEIIIWKKIKKVANDSTELLGKNNFRVDWIGRIYTVINLPEEMLSRPDLQEGWVFSQLREYDAVFLEMGIGDYLFPEILHIPDRGAYLLILTGPRDFINWIKFIWNLIKLSGFIILGRILYILVKDNWNTIIESFTNIWNYIF